MSNISEVISEYHLNLTSTLDYSSISIGGGNTVPLNETQLSATTDRILRNIIITISYMIIVIVSLCGNILVCKTVIKKWPNNPTNVLIANLALSDILMTVFNIPFTVVDILLTDWIFGQAFCILVPFIQACCVYVSSFTMLVIAINRWHSVYNNQNNHARCRNGRLLNKRMVVILVIWLMAAIHSLPHTVFNRVIYLHTSTNGVIRRCRTIPPGNVPRVQLWISLLTFLTQYVIPLSISAIVYLRIGLTIASLGRVGSSLNQEQSSQLCHKKIRRIVLLVLIVSIFAVCWLPFHIYYLLADFGVTKYNFRIFLWVHWLAMSSVCYNPLLYCWLNENFRKETKNIVKFLLRMKANTRYDSIDYHNNKRDTVYYHHNTNTTNL